MTRRTAVLMACIPCLVAALLAPGPAARAEERKNSWEFGLFSGQTFNGNELQLSNELNYGFRVGWNFQPAFELEFQYTSTSNQNLQQPDSILIDNVGVFFADPNRSFTSDAYSLRFLINPTNERRRLKPYMFFGGGQLEHTGDPELTPAEEDQTSTTIFTFGGGLRQRLAAHLAFRAEFEYQYSLKHSYNNQYANVGLTWVFGGGSPGDGDGDGILDLIDRCPDTPAGALVDKHDGCPWDLDLDGVMEGLDQCAGTPRDWAVDEKGCALDSDGDAVPDGADECTDTPAGAIVDAQGCPLDTDGDTVFDGIDRCQGTPLGAFVDPPDNRTAGCPHDSDKDSIFDGVDECVLTPAGATVDEKGCPQDSDGDRILDGIDQCPDTPQDQKIDREGCPRVRLDRDDSQLLENVRFYGLELYPGSGAWLELLVDAANYWYDVKFELGIYTDSTGSREGNLNAARRRGEVVKGWLVERGIDPARMVLKPYGSVNFIADNETEVGRDKNRRVEVRRLSGDARKHPERAPDADLMRETAPPEPATEAAPEAPAPEPEEVTPPATEGGDEGEGDAGDEGGMPDEEPAPDTAPDETAASPGALNERIRTLTARPAGLPSHNGPDRGSARWRR